MRPECLGIVGLDVDPSEGGATFLVASSLDSVVTRWSLDGKQEARKELGPAESWGVSIHPRTLHLATAGSEARVKIMSSSVDNFGEEVYAMDAAGAFATAIKFVSIHPGSIEKPDGSNYFMLILALVTPTNISEPRRPVPRGGIKHRIHHPVRRLELQPPLNLPRPLGTDPLSHLHLLAPHLWL